MNKTEQEDKEVLTGELQTIQQRQKLFRTLDEALDYVKFAKPKRVYIELVTLQDRRSAYVLEMRDSEGEDN